MVMKPIRVASADNKKNSCWLNLPFENRERNKAPPKKTKHSAALKRIPGKPGIMICSAGILNSHPAIIMIPAAIMSRLTTIIVLLFCTINLNIIGTDIISIEHHAKAHNNKVMIK